jgi:hypothetical protein
MADFCKECSIKLFGEDFHDLAGLISEEKVKEGLGVSVLCEECGIILVDHTGKRISKKGGEN